MIVSWKSCIPQEKIHILTHHNMYVYKETKAIVSCMIKVPWNQMPCWEFYSKKTHKTKQSPLFFTLRTPSDENNTIWTKSSICRSSFSSTKQVGLHCIPHCSPNNIRNSVFSFWTGNLSYYLISDPAYSLTYYLLTHSMEQSSSWEANWLSASEEVPWILWPVFTVRSC